MLTNSFSYKCICYKCLCTDSWIVTRNKTGFLIDMFYIHRGKTKCIS